MVPARNKAKGLSSFSHTSKTIHHYHHHHHHHHHHHLTHAFSACDRVTPLAKFWFTVLIYKLFKAFMEAMIYTLLEVTTVRLKILHQFLFLKVYQGLRKSSKKCKNLLQLVIVFQEF